MQYFLSHHFILTLRHFTYFLQEMLTFNIKRLHNSCHNLVLRDAVLLTERKGNL